MKITEMHIQRLMAADRELARQLFVIMTEVFGEECAQLSDNYLDHLLSRVDFWAIAALVGDEIIGGITGHTLPMTRSESSEVFIYDIAVQAAYQRQGVGRQLVSALRESAAIAGIQDVFVPADNDDIHALDFYRALGGVAAPVTFFTFSRQSPGNINDAMV